MLLVYLQGKTKIKNFEEFSSNLGLAFQIKDDLWMLKVMKKKLKTKKDKIKGKETLITLMGKDKARKSQDLIVCGQ